MTNQLVVHLGHSLTEANKAKVSDVIDLVNSDTLKEHLKAERKKWEALFKTIANSRG